ncbi:MAG: IS4 family transposase [FCB group bacterium]|nr:IS4 family transposase [FCB group bacterium]
MILTKLLPDHWQDKARELGALIRRRKIDQADTLLRVLLMYLADDKSFRTVSAYAQEAGLCDINDTSLLNRLRLSKDWFHWMAQELLKRLNSNPLPEQAFKKFNVRLVDGTMINEPGVTGSSWRIHYSLRLSDLQCDAFRITSPKTGESFQRYPVEKNDLLIGDRGYCKRKGIVHVLKNQGHVLVRFHSTNLPLFNRRGKPVSVLSWLRSLPDGTPGDLDVWFKDPETDSLIKGRLCALRKSKEAIAKSRKKLHRYASKKSVRLKPETLEYAGYFIQFTTLNRHHFQVEELLNLYRYRWQIELIFKRLKGIMGIGHLPTMNEASSIAWLYGKMVVALLTECLYHEAEFFSPWGYPIRPPVYG